MKKILVTDSLFIFDEHVKQLKDAGYGVERLDKPQATEEELIQALKGKVGYILGGMEKVTDTVLKSAHELKAIAFTGADWKALIPGWETAKEKEIAISNSPGANSIAVAEFSIAAALSMERNLFELGRTGDKKFQTSESLQNKTVGVIGAGRIGSRIIKMLSAFEPKKIIYYNRSKKDGIDAEFVSLDQLIQNSDVIFVAVPGTAEQIINKETIQKMKNNALLVSISPFGVIDFDALLTRLEKGNLRAAVDWPAPKIEFTKLPLSIWFNTNSHTAYNTHESLKKCSDMGTQSLINLLKTGEDQYRVI